MSANGCGCERLAAELAEERAHVYRLRQELGNNTAQLLKRLDDCADERDSIYALYHELVFCVSNRYPSETRHQTAKRYLLEHESTLSDIAVQARGEK